MNQVKPPAWIKEERLAACQDKAQQLVQALHEQTGPGLTRLIGGIGAQAQERMMRANDLMNQSVHSLLSGLEGDSPAGRKLLELRATMDELNPHALHNAWWFRWMPGSLKRRLIARFVARYQPMHKHVTEILNGLRAGKDDLLETSLMLERQYNEIAEAKKEIEAEIYIGELFIREIEAAEQQGESDPQVRQKLAVVKNQAMRRVRDLRTMEQAAVQFFISIDQTIATNTLLSEQIDSALTVGPLVMQNALRIQAALAKQKAVENAVRSFQDGLGDLMAQNAQAVNQAARNVGELYNNPVIGLQELEKGYDQLMQAVQTANATLSESTLKAREAADRLAEMTAGLEPVSAGLREAREASAAQAARLTPGMSRASDAAGRLIPE